MLSLPGTVAQFERDLIQQRQRESIGLAKRRSAYTSHKNALAARKKVRLARVFGISRAA
jgi:DNA invertase Pin-like site-specific DNA recombinase